MDMKRKRLRDESEIGGDVPLDMVNWCNLPLDIVERIIGRLGWLDRIRTRSVCKAWSVSTPHIPTIDENFPWALRLTLKNQQLIYPPLHQEIKIPLRKEELQIFHKARAHASSYGWVLFEAATNPHGLGNFLLYSPFTNEVIELPEYELMVDDVATFSLDATSPKCVIFGLGVEDDIIRIYICSLGDTEWVTYEFDFFEGYSTPEHATYAGGIFYCVFSGGELGAFNLQLKEWTILTLEGLPDFDFEYAKLIASDGELRVMGNSKDLQSFKFDFSEKRWVKENSLNNRVFFIGKGTFFSCPAVGETSQLANHVFQCCNDWYPIVRCYGTKSDSLQYQNWVKTASCLNTWSLGLKLLIPVLFGVLMI
ncbi:hypothetical protein COLO4_15077 [Corchorus olitorius]|uniref:Uncharacterized protein n=1 Tax=Corchorus olitorius TaxID=93759 RepID=A0A1R3JPP2_9ROSI|nr:hypothetical protein COLO4_15077 [Corchorus olitorius]